MRNLPIIILFLLAVAVGYSQPSTFRATFQKVTTETPSNGGTYAAQGFFEDADGLGYAASDIKTDTTVLQDNRGYTYRVVYKSGTSPLYLEYNPIEASTDLQSGTALIADPIGQDTTINLLPEVGVKVVDKNRASGETRFREKQDSINVDLQTQITSITGSSPLAIADQIITADRIISGSYNYALELDSFNEVHINSRELLLTDSVTTPLLWSTPANYYDSLLSGYVRINSVSLDLVALRKGNGDDEFGTVIMSRNTGTGAVLTRVYTQRETGANDLESSIDITPDYVKLYNKKIIENGFILINEDLIEIGGTDSLVISTTGVTTDNTIPYALVVDTASGRAYLRDLGTQGDVEYSAGNGARISATGYGVTFTRTSSTIGTFNIPDGVQPLGFSISHSGAQNPGNTYEIKFVYAGTAAINNNINDYHAPTVTVWNTQAAVLNGNIPTVANPIIESVTTGTINLVKNISGFIDSAGYFGIYLENYDDAAGGGTNASKIEGWLNYR